MRSTESLFGPRSFALLSRPTRSVARSPVASSSRDVAVAARARSRLRSLGALAGVHAVDRRQVRAVDRLLDARRPALRHLAAGRLLHAVQLREERLPRRGRVRALQRERPGLRVRRSLGRLRLARRALVLRRQVREEQRLPQRLRLRRPARRAVERPRPRRRPEQADVPRRPVRLGRRRGDAAPSCLPALRLPSAARWRPTSAAIDASAPRIVEAGTPPPLVARGRRRRGSCRRRR